MKKVTIKTVYLVMSLFLMLVMPLILTGCSASEDDEEPISRTGFAMNTVIKIDLYDTTDSTILDECFALCTQYEAIFSRTLTTSELYQINHDESNQVSVSDDMYKLLSIGISYGDLSSGLFDITIAPLSDLWNFSSDSPTVPTDDEINALLPLVDYKTLSLTEDQVLIRENPDTMIDLGAIAKGYIADRIKDYLITQGVTSAVINLGGNVLCIGSKPDGSSFHIGIQKPFAAQDEIAAAFELTNMSVVTSGIYERYFEEDGILYHHLLDVSTGYPCSNDLQSVTILSSDSVDGDALSTTCFLLGLDDGMALIDSMDGFYAMFITSDGLTHFSKGADQFLMN